MGRITSVAITEEDCLAHEMCVTECPEVFQIRDGESFASIRPDASQFFVSKDRDVRSAIECCPMACIHITESDD